MKNIKNPNFIIIQNEEITKIGYTKNSVYPYPIIPRLLRHAVKKYGKDVQVIFLNFFRVYDSWMINLPSTVGVHTISPSVYTVTSNNKEVQEMNISYHNKEVRDLINSLTTKNDMKKYVIFAKSCIDDRFNNDDFIIKPSHIYYFTQLSDGYECNIEF